MAKPFHALFAPGVICDLVTPFQAAGIDSQALVDLVDWQIESGVAAVLACGPAGEDWALSDAQRTEVIRVCVTTAAGRIPVIAGTGTNSTQTTIARTAEARALGADAAYIVTPPYSKPSQQGLFHHYEVIARSVDLPLIVGLAPARTAIDLAPRTLERLASLPSVAGIVDASGDMARLVMMPAALRQRFLLYSGHDLTALSFNLAGGSGTVSAAANIVPRWTVAMHHALNTANLASARALQEQLIPLFQALERESLAPAVKYGLCLLRGMNDDVRLPLTPIVPETAAALRMALAPVLSRSDHSSASSRRYVR